MGLIGTVTTSRVPITSAPPKTWAAAAMGLIVTALGIGVAGAEALAGAGPPVGAVGVIVGGTGGMLADAVVASRVGLGRVALGDAVTSGGVLGGRAVVRVAVGVGVGVGEIDVALGEGDGVGLQLGRPGIGLPPPGVGDGCTGWQSGEGPLGVGACVTVALGPQLGSGVALVSGVGRLGVALGADVGWLGVG